jgi:hypothetical protein
MEMIFSVKKIVQYLCFFTLFSVLFSACIEKECLASKQVRLGVSFIQDSSNKAYVVDSITVKGVGVEEKIYDNTKNISQIYLPLKSLSTQTSYDVLLNETPFILTITHQNVPQLLSIECGTVVFYEIESAEINGEMETTPQIVNSKVQNLQNEIHIHIRL